MVRAREVRSAHPSRGHRDHRPGDDPLVRQVLEKYPNTPEAPEALYWAGVSKCKATGDAAALKETGQRLGDRYQDSTWATKASVWK